MTLAEKVGNPRARSLCHNFLGALQYLQGDWPTATTNLQRGLDLARESKDATGETAGWGRLGQLETARGELETAHEHLQIGVEAAERSTMRAHLLVWLHSRLIHNRLEAGELAQASRYLSTGLAVQEAHGHCVTCNVALYPVAAQAHLASGDLQAAAAFCDLADGASDEYGSVVWIAVARQVRGCLDLAQAHPVLAAGHFQEAAEGFAAIGQPYDAAVARAGWAEALLAIPDRLNRRRARELLTSARETLGSLGARPALARVGWALERIGPPQ